MAKLVIFFLCFIGVLARVKASNYSVTPEVDLGYARYRGKANNTSGINSFFGIQYAKPPTGPLRWKEPVAIDSQPWPASKPLVDASLPGSQCFQIDPAPWFAVQLPTNGSSTDEAEDCLLLDILVPSHPVASKLPVLVNIPGGGYVTGSSGGAPGDALVYQAKGEMIFVSIQYRLGVFGFLAGDDIQSSGAPNAGLLDQRAALEWIQRNIRHFGGDPDKVTVTGGSAGGSSITLQMMLHGGEEALPFRAAIPEYAWWTPIYNQTWVNKQYSRVLGEAQCADLDCLRDIPAVALNGAAIRAWEVALNLSETAYGTFYYGPTIDGKAVLGLPVDEFKARRFSPVPVLATRDMYEGPLFSPFNLFTKEQTISDLKTLWQTVPEATIEEVLELFPPNVYNNSLVEGTGWFNALAPGFNATTAFVQRQAIFGASVVDCPSTAIIQAAVDAGQKAYKVVFEAGTQLHAATTAYLWSKELDSPGSDLIGAETLPGNVTLARAMRDYVASFVIHVDPNKFTGTTQPPFWPEFTDEGRQILHAQDSSINVAYDFDSTEQCDLLLSLSTL